jgi:transporter family protein
LKLGNAPCFAPLDKLSVVLVVVFGILFVGEKLTMLN